MSTSIAFLSGKGGSGKTTLAISIANLLCRCDVRTLLVDCDLSTNGATYFYESQLVDQQNDKQSYPFSYNELLNKINEFKELSILNIRPNLDFIPSVSEISDQYLLEKVGGDVDQEIQLREFVNWAQLCYDVILFDCQAGYTDLLPVLLPMMDVNLFVLEADSISGSAMRNLHLKIGRFLGRGRLYQIFNKATPEEFETYSKIVGTFFTNIGTLMFDWKIRQAFSRSQVPDLENTSAKYSLDLCNICNIILSEKDIKKRLLCFSDQLRYQELDEDREQTKQELYKFTNKSRLIKKLLVYLTCFLSIGAFLFVILERNMFQNEDFTQSFVATVVAVISISLSNLLIDSSQDTRKERQNLEHKLKNIDRQLVKLEKSLQDNTNNQYCK